MIQFLRLQKKNFFKIIFWMKVKNNIKMILKKLQKIFLKLMKLKVKILKHWMKRKNYYLLENRINCKQI